MAKSKPLGKGAAKKFASKSTVQKNGRSEKPRGAVHQHKETAKSFPKRHMKVIPQQKAKKKSENPLAMAFSGFSLPAPTRLLIDLYFQTFTDSLEASRSFLQQQAKVFITTTREDLVQQVVALNTHFEKEAQAIAKSGEVVRKPLEQDQLHFLGKDGKSAGTQALGDRMKIFKDIVEAEKRTIRDLAKQWAEIDQNFIGLALEVLGPEEIGNLQRYCNRELSDYTIPRDKSFEEEVQSKIDQLKSEITKVNDTMMLLAETHEDV